VRREDGAVRQHPPTLRQRAAGRVTLRAALGFEIFGLAALTVSVYLILNAATRLGGTSASLLAYEITLAGPLPIPPTPAPTRSGRPSPDTITPAPLPAPDRGPPRRTGSASDKINSPGVP
jgi:hypothetical protein